MSAPTSSARGVIDSTAADHRTVARIGWFTVVEHRVKLIRYFWPTMLITGIGSPFLYLLGLGFGLRSTGGPGKGIEGVPYLHSSLLHWSWPPSCRSAQENTFGVFGGFKWSNTFTAMRLTPLSPAQMAVGYQASTLVRVSIALVFYLIALLVFR